jgi:hypothetical protein
MSDTYHTCPCGEESRNTCTSCQDLPVWYFDKPDKPLFFSFDVDYPYPSRPLSFLSVLTGLHPKYNYLRNAKIIAKIINQSQKQIKAYWFFTPHTIPDKELLSILFDKPLPTITHEIGVHVINNFHSETSTLEKATNTKIRFYTIHGTEHLLSQLLWHRKHGQKTITLTKDDNYSNFSDYPTISLDVYTYHEPQKNVILDAKTAIENGWVLHAHPEWLFNTGTINHRGRFYEVLYLLTKKNNL